MRTPKLWFVLPLFLVLLRSSAANEVPEPLPTPASASEGRASTLTAGCVVSRSDEVDLQSAREAAWLTALYRLAVQVEPPEPGAPFRVDPAHARYDLLGWLLASRTSEEQSTGGVVRVTLESPPLDDLDSRPPLPTEAFQADLDGDGQPERITAAPDSRIYVYSGERLLAVSPGLGHLQGRALSGPRGQCETILLSRPVAVVGAEAAGPGLARLQVRFVRSEAIGLRCAGRAEEEREVLLRLVPPEQAPTIEISEPDLRRAPQQARIPLRGRVLAPAGLREVHLSLNGQELWRSPEGLNGQKLKLDLVLDLRPGGNCAVLKATDRNGLEVERRLELRSPVPAMPGRGVALVVTPEAPDGDGQTVRQALQAAGLEVRALSIPDLGAALGALARESRPGDTTILYMSGLASLQGASAGGLLPGSGDPRDLAAGLQSLEGRRVLVVLDLAATGEADGQARWLAASDLLDSLSGPGRLVLVSGLPSPDGQGTLTWALLEAWRSGGDPLAAALRAYPAAVESAAARARDLKSPQPLPLLRED